MKKYDSVVTTVAILLCWAAASVATSAQHEGHGGQKPPAQKDQQQPETQHKCWQMELPSTTPNHPLAIAYLQTIATLTRLLRDQVQQCNSVNGDFARDVVAEIWRSFDQLLMTSASLGSNLISKILVGRKTSEVVEIADESSFGAGQPGRSNPAWLLGDNRLGDH